jgi:hypothetical protein
MFSMKMPSNNSPRVKPRQIKSSLIERSKPRKSVCQGMLFFMINPQFASLLSASKTGRELKERI